MDENELDWRFCFVQETHDAVKKNYDIGALLAKNPNLLVERGVYGSVLHIAAEFGKENLVAQLLAASPSLVNTLDGHNRTPLHSAAAEGHDKSVSLLITAKPSLVDAIDVNGRVALHDADRKSVV